MAIRDDGFFFRARAPGKLMLAGEYAVFHGSEAWVLAVDRYATVTSRRSHGSAHGPAHTVPPEARAAWQEAVRDGLLHTLPDEESFEIDLGQMRSRDRKLGIGSSAAGCVAALAWAVAHERYDNKLDPELLDRERLARIARRGHRVSQNGGSGVDVLSSALGGALRVRFPAGLDADPEVTQMPWPVGVRVGVLWSGTPVKTSEMLSRVEALRQSDNALHGGCMNAVSLAAGAMGEAFGKGDSRAFVTAVRAHNSALMELGCCAGVPIVTRELAILAERAEGLGAAVKPSGAGGGDVSLVVANDDQTVGAVCELAARLGFEKLQLGLDEGGVKVEEGTR